MFQTTNQYMFYSFHQNQSRNISNMFLHSTKSSNKKMCPDFQGLVNVLIEHHPLEISSPTVTFSSDVKQIPKMDQNGTNFPNLQQLSDQRLGLPWCFFPTFLSSQVLPRYCWRLRSQRAHLLRAIVFPTFSIVFPTFSIIFLLFP